MINEKLIDSFLKNVEKECLIRGMKEIFNHLKIQSSYEYDNLIYNIIDIIGGCKLIFTQLLAINKIVGVEALKSDIEQYIYRPEEVDKDSIEITNIDNINHTLVIKYNRKDVQYANTDVVVYNKYLKNIK